MKIMKRYSDDIDGSGDWFETTIDELKETTDNGKLLLFNDTIETFYENKFAETMYAEWKIV